MFAIEEFSLIFLIFIHIVYDENIIHATVTEPLGAYYANKHPKNTIDYCHCVSMGSDSIADWHTTTDVN
jgi:hypothetical protein